MGKPVKKCKILANLKEKGDGKAHFQNIIYKFTFSLILLKIKYGGLKSYLHLAEHP